MKRTFSLLYCLWLASAITAAANPLDRFGAGARAPGMGNAVGADVDDYTAAYYNPAAFGFIKYPTAGWSVSYHDVNLELDGANRDVFYDSDGDGQADAARTEKIDAWAEDVRGIDLGLSLPVGGILRNRLGLGMLLHLPGMRIIRVKANDPDEPFWYHYDNSVHKLMILLGAGIRITDMISVGGGAQILVDVPISLDASFNISTNQTQATSNPSTGNVDAELYLVESPTAGVLFEPIDELKFGLTFRDKLSLIFEGELLLNLEMYVDLLDIGGEKVALSLVAPVPVTVKAETIMQPRSLDFSAWADADSLVEGLRFAFDLQWMEFSKFKGNQLHLYISQAARESLANQINGMLQEFGPLLTALPISGVSFSEVQIYIATKEFPPPRFRDILIPRLGVEYDVNDWWTARAGAFYEPSPVPDQKGLSCYLDSDRSVFALGSTFKFADPLEIADNPVELDIYGQYHQLKNRTTTKVHNDDLTRPDTTFNRYTAGGDILGAGLGLTWKF